jgi:radical SAM superfamily enzyme YgiQ (UPF0313 family)
MGVSFGISSIASVCKQAGHDVRLFVAVPNAESIQHLLDAIKNDRPRVLALTAVTSQYPLISRIAARAKAIDPDLTVILGGHHATLNPEAVIKQPFFDAICVGEGEEAIVDFLDQLSRGEQPAGINNLWIKNRRTGSADRYSQAPFIQNLDSLPFIFRSLWEDWVSDKSRMHSILVSRGCPNKCTYCSNHALCKTGTGKYLRFRSAENIVLELTQIAKAYPEVQSVYLEAETLSIDLPYLYKLCKALEDFNAGLSRPLSFGTNLSMTAKIIGNKELFEALKRANFNFINIGLESGSERIRNEILRRPKYTNEEIASFCKSVKDYGIKVDIFALIGIPGETLNEYRETVACIRECNPDHVYLSIFYPYPGTDLYERVKQQGLLQEEMANPELERSRATLDLPGFSKNQIQREFVLFAYRAFKGRKSLPVIATIILRTYCGTHPVLNRFYRYAVRHPLLRAVQKRVAYLTN